MNEPNKGGCLSSNKHSVILRGEAVLPLRVLRDHPCGGPPILTYYREAMAESQKVRKFLNEIEFGPIDVGKDMVLFHTHMPNGFSSTNYYLSQFMQKNNRPHFREISTTVQKKGVWGYRVGRGRHVVKGIGNRNSTT